MQPSFDLVLSAATPVPLVEAALSIGRALSAAGHDVRAVEDALPAAEKGRVLLVVAPHEVLPYLDVGGREVADSLARSVLVSTARPSSPEWAWTLDHAVDAGAVLDISDAGVTAFAAAGVTAHRFRLGYDAANDFSAGSLQGRPLDVVFLGTSTARRQRLLAAAAPFLSHHDIDLRLVDGVPNRASAISGFVSGADKYRLLASSKIALNLHPDEDPLFEWLRARDALANGCLLVSELSSGATPLDPGRHFVSIDHAHLGSALDRLLSEPERLEAIRAEGAAFFREGVQLSREVEVVVEQARSVPDERRSPSRAREQTDADTVLPVVPDGGPDDPMYTAMLRQNAVLKRLFIEIRSLRREVAHVRHVVEEPGEPLVRTTSTPGWDSQEQRDVTVIVTLHNYGRFVREAISSALDSRDVRVEVVVIDDRSTDEGPVEVRSLMDERPDSAVLLLEQRVNTGVQRARNLAFEHARAPFAFVLDADNVIYPRGIHKLHERLLQDSNAAFAYGIIERFDDEGSVDLMGVEGWDERRLARSHYIDAMALVRVDAWREVGGYVTDPALELGWEDYDLWLNFASHGYRGVHVREIVARYRVHGISALAVTTLDTSELLSRLQARHSQFFRHVADGVFRESPGEH